MILSQIIILPAVPTPVPVVHIPKHGREDPRQSMDHRVHFLPAYGNILPVEAMLFFLKFQYPKQAVSQMQHYKTTEKLPGDSAVPGSIVRSHNRFRSRKNCTYLSDRSKRNHPQNFGLSLIHI